VTTPLHTALAHLEAQGCVALDNGDGRICVLYWSRGVGQVPDGWTDDDGDILRPAWSGEPAPQK
jgi:hypothetical protein